MGRKKVLEKRLARLQAKKNDLASRALASQDAAEVRSINSQIEDLNAEIEETEEEIAAIDAEADPAPAVDPEPTPAPAAPDARGFNPLAAYNVRTAPQAQEDVPETATMEYRTAFMNYVQRGQMSDVLRQAQTRANNYAGNVSEDLGILIPKTVIQEIIKGVEKVYGQLYSRVKKTNVRGGVRYPIGSFSATFHRITEYGEGAAPTARQKGGKITGYVQFAYNIGEIRLAKTLLESVLEVPVFEQELSKVIVETYVEAMDKEIMTGDPDDGECEGILTEAAKDDSRIPESNIIEFTAEDMADWTAWQTKLFAVIPLSMRALRPEFVMTAHTYEANIKTLKDDNNRPVYNETFNPVDGAETATFKGKQVVFVEEDILENFNDASDGDYFGMYWIPEKAYAINTNLEFFVKRYFDDEKNEWVDKALVINDGKILDPKYLYLLKKKVTA